MGIGQRLKEARLSRQITQESLADYVGVSKGAIGNYETDRSSPNEPILIKLMEVLQIDANYLYQDYIRSNDYSDEEKHLIALFRGAEESAKEYAVEMLANHQIKTPVSSVG